MIQDQSFTIQSNSRVCSILHVHEPVLEAQFASAWVAANTQINQRHQQQESRCYQCSCSHKVRVIAYCVFYLCIAVSSWPSLVDVRKSVNEVVGRGVIAPSCAVEKVLNCAQCLAHVSFLHSGVQQVGTLLPSSGSACFIGVRSGQEQVGLFGNVKKIFGSLLKVALAGFAESEVGFDVDTVGQSESGVVSIFTCSTEELGGDDLSSNTQTEEDDEEDNDKYLEHTNETGTIFLKPINAHNRTEHNDQISSNQDSQNGLSLLSIVEEDFAVSKSIDGDAGHAETDDQNEEGAEARDSLEAAQHHFVQDSNYYNYSICYRILFQC